MGWCRSVLIVTLAAVACTAAPGSPPARSEPTHATAEPRPEPHHDIEPTVDAAGIWIFDQPTHALYEASIYDLRADGTMAPVGLIEAAVDSVSRGPLSCRFGDRWRAPAPDALQLRAVCNDEQERTIELRLSGHEPGRLGIDSVRVDGQEGWEHPGYPWSIVRCPDPEGQCRQLVEQALATVVVALQPRATCSGEQISTVCMVERGEVLGAQWTHLWIFGEPVLVLGPGTATGTVSAVSLRPTSDGCFQSDRSYGAQCSVAELAGSLLRFDPDFSPLATRP